MKKKLPFIISILLLISCSGDSPYSGYAAFFTCDTSFPPFNQVSGFGQFVTVKRKTSTSYEVTNAQGITYEHQLTEAEARQKFQYGLGGFIIGTPSAPPNEDYSIWAYDWACPNCDMARYRLDIDDIGLATCHNCGTVFDLNSGGIPIKGDSRTLWRYRVFMSGTYLTIQN